VFGDHFGPGAIGSDDEGVAPARPASDEACAGRDAVDVLVEDARQVGVLDLDDQGDVGCGSDLEMFFWQCSASSVTMAPRATPSSASSVCAAGISLDFSAMSM